MINTKINQNLLAVNGDLFDGEKVSQLTSSTFGQDSESESEKEHKREPGDPGTSLPVMDSNLVSPFHNDPSDGDAPTSGLASIPTSAIRQQMNMMRRRRMNKFIL